MMALTIQERVGEGWRTVRLVPATLTRDVWSTMLHGRTGQEISDGWLDEGSTVHIRPGDVGHTSHLFTTADELPTAWDYVYDEQGMRHRIQHSAWSSLTIQEGAR